MNTPHTTEIEKKLANLPRFTRSEAADTAFYKKLASAAIEPRAVSFFVWPRVAFASVCAVFVLLIAGTVVAYQPNTTRGTLLYPWKQTVEKVELALAFNPTQKIDAHLKFSDRRLEEAKNIISRSPNLSWLLNTAFAHEGEIHLDSEEAINLSLTLADMRREVTHASEILENRIEAPAAAEAILAKLETTTEKHVETLDTFAKKMKSDAREIVNRIADEENNHLAAVIEAREETKLARSRDAVRIKVIVMPQMPLRGKSPRFSHAQARREFEQAMATFTKLPAATEGREEFKERIETAQKAFEEGNWGRALGVSRAFQKHFMPTESELQPHVKILNGKEMQQEESGKNRQNLREDGKNTDGDFIKAPELKAPKFERPKFDPADEKEKEPAEEVDKDTMPQGFKKPEKIETLEMKEKPQMPEIKEMKSPNTEEIPSDIHDAFDFRRDSRSDMMPGFSVGP